MAKEIEVWYTGTWNTTLEVPDDFDASPDNIEALIEANASDFDFQDGGADWKLDCVEVNGETISML